MPLSLRQAAKEAGVAKTTLIRSLRSGRLSASKNELGDWSIDPAELHRVFPLRPQDQADQGSAPVVLDQGAPPSGPPETTRDRERVVALEAQVLALKELIQRLDQDKLDLRAERDRWASQAERLALPKPEPAKLPNPWWWPFRG